MLQFPGTEADDIVAYIRQIVLSDPKYAHIEHIWLISTDRDYDLLICDKVSRFSYVTRKETTASNWSTHYEFSTEDYISIKCLMGDAGDNVPGAANVGPKRAMGLVNEYGSAFDIAASLPIKSSLKYIQSLNEFGAEQLLLNYQLMDLVTYCGEALGNNTQTIKQTLESYLV